MNIFVLDRNPVIAAQMQCDKHVVKMILESFQMLSTAHRVLDGEVVNQSRKYWLLNDRREDVLYKPSHVNHPCNQWVRESSDNYRWLYNHAIALSKEYTYRYGKNHKSYEKLSNITEMLPKNIPTKEMTDFALAMDSDYVDDDPVVSYRNYYFSKRSKFSMVWTGRQQPEWYANMVSIEAL